MAGAFGFQDYGAANKAAVGTAIAGGAPAAAAQQTMPIGEEGATAIPGFGADAKSARPELSTSDDNYDPTYEHSPSSTAAMVGQLISRTSGGGSGAGKIQNPSAAMPGQREQFAKMGLTPAELDLLERMGAAKPEPSSDVEVGEAPDNESAEMGMR